jgi:hypothetical protein
MRFVPPRREETEPISFRWAGGVVELGYLGRFRWRVRQPNAVVEADDARAAAVLALDPIFRGAKPGHEALERAPLRIQVGTETSTLDVDARMVNGWTYHDANVRFDLGSHEKLTTFVADLLARNAATAWACGVEPVRPRSIGQEFSFDAFVGAADRDALCRNLAAILTQRLRDSPCPPVALTAAVQELRLLGHDLWSWEHDEIWGRDYMTRRAGAGLLVTRTCNEDEDPVEETVQVEFQPPA